MSGQPCVSCGRTSDPHSADCLGVPIFCPLCERDIGPVFPSIDRNQPLPAVEHLPSGRHLFQWSNGDWFSL